jgi:iduronate 2-sulfatase
MTNYDMDTRVPLIIKPAKSTAGKGARDQIVESVDIYPTLCELAGIPLPDELSGNSFASNFSDEGEQGKPYAFSQFLRYGKWHAPDCEEMMGYTVRSKDWRYVEWFHSNSDTCIAKELYDVTSQGLEQENLEGRAAYAEIEQTLAAELKKYRGDTLPLESMETR